MKETNTRLSLKERMTICRALETQGYTMGLDYPTLAKKIHEDLGITVSPQVVAYHMRELDIPYTGRAPKNTGAKAATRIVAKELCRVMQELGIEQSGAFKELCRQLDA